MEERRNTMERKKFGAGLIALVVGVALSAGSAFAQLGYLQGDPSPGKLIPYYNIDANTATIIGLENVGNNDLGVTGTTGFIFVHVVIFSTYSVEQFDATLCLSPYDFGYITLQNSIPTGAQATEAIEAKNLIASVEGGIASSGYVTLAVTGEAHDCLGTSFDTTASVLADTLAAWTILQDVGTGFYGTEIPTTTANVNTTTGVITCAGTTCPGLIPTGNEVIARYDVNPAVSSVTSIFVWLNSNGTFISGGTFSRAVSAFLQCEDEAQFSTTLQLPAEINVLNPADLTGMDQCILLSQYRGVLRFALPDTGFLWSHISQASSNYRMNFLGYNLDTNSFIP